MRIWDLFRSLGYNSVSTHRQLRLPVFSFPSDPGKVCWMLSALRFLTLCLAAMVVLPVQVSADPPRGEDGQKSQSAVPAEKYQLSATLTYYCTVRRTQDLHPVLFDFHNASCAERQQVVDHKLPTLPKSPRYRDVRIAGYHLADWSEGQPSPHTQNRAQIEVSKTATTISASGWLEKASCSKGLSGENLVQETLWQAAVVPEVQFIEDEGHEEPATEAVIDAHRRASSVLALHSSCADAHELSLQYSVAPMTEDTAAAPVYTSPVLNADQSGHDEYVNGDSLSIRTRWSHRSAKGDTILRITISRPGGN